MGFLFYLNVSILEHYCFIIKKILIPKFTKLIMDLQIAIMKKILRKLINLSIWGGRHTEIKNLQKGLPSHIRGTKEYKKSVKDLIKMDFLKIKPSTGEFHVGLNSHKQKEIFEFLGERE